jgi:hypothetical protein
MASIDKVERDADPQMLQELHEQVIVFDRLA